MLYLLVLFIVSPTDVYLRSVYVVGSYVSDCAVDANPGKPPYPIN